MGKLLQILISALLLIACTYGDESSTDKSDCKALNNKFVQNNTEYLDCVLHNNEKGTFCEDCLQVYKSLTDSYTNLINGHEMANKTEKQCRSRFVDNNQLSLVDTVYANSKHIWELSSCSDCFDPNCDFGNIAATCNMSDHFMKFETSHTNINDCIEQPKKKPTEICSNCTEKYESLTKIYNNIRLKTLDKFCFDIKDKMNKTQIRWSQELKCCNDRKTSEVEFISLSCVTIFVSILFYIGTYFFTMRKERVQPIPDDLMPPEHMESHSSGPVMNINATEPSINDSPGTVRTNFTRTTNASEDDLSSSSDDEPLQFQSIVQTNVEPNLLDI